MVTINFEYNLKRDAYNWVRQIIFLPNRSIDFIPLSIQEEVKQLYEKNKISHKDLMESLQHPVIEFMADYIKQNQDINLVELKRAKLEKTWKKNETDFFEIISKLLNKPIYEASYSCYLSTTYNCPFYEKENWFMTSALNELTQQIYIVAHEFMHLQFIYWHKEYCLGKGLDNKQFWHIQEALTFLLNEPEFSNIIFFEDPGRSIHQDLIKKLRAIWNNNKDFQIFLDEAIEIVKEEFPEVL